MNEYIPFLGDKQVEVVSFLVQKNNLVTRFRWSIHSFVHS